MQVAAMRIFFAFIFFLPFIIRRIKKIKKLTRREIIALIILGFIGNAIPAILFTTAQYDQRVSSALAGMLNAITPLFVWLIGISFYKSKTKWVNFIGILINLGASFLALFWGELDARKDLLSAHPLKFISGIFILNAVFSESLADFLDNSIHGKEELDSKILRKALFFLWGCRQ